MFDEVFALMLKRMGLPFCYDECHSGRMRDEWLVAKGCAEIACDVMDIPRPRGDYRMNPVNYYMGLKDDLIVRYRGRHIRQEDTASGAPRKNVWGG